MPLRSAMTRWRRLAPWRVAGFAVATVLAGGCATGAARHGAGTPLPVPGFRVFESGASAFVPFERLVDAAAAADVVFFGENHDDPETHRAQLALLERLGARGGAIALSLEMFERDVQESLDDYLAGRTPEKSFLAAARPWTRYATDYRPMVELARSRGWPVVAANVPRSIASAVGRRGLEALDTLPARERAWAAAEHMCPRDDYYTRFVQAMPQHDMPGTTGNEEARRLATDRFYLAQCVKDEAMGESVARTRQGTGRPLVVHLDGSFHSDFAAGTVARALRRLPGASSLVITAIPLPDIGAADATAHRGRADFVVFTARVPAASPPAKP